jgi:predicted deacylase
MPTRLKTKSVGRWGSQVIAPGESAEVTLNVSESYAGRAISIPLFVRRAIQDGPVVFVTAAIHGDEINGLGAIRSLIADGLARLTRGALILAPVINILGYERHSRYLPDRRDLNRCFPGSATGSTASRMARLIFDEIVGRSDYGIDLHTAAVRRTNFPNIRADMKHSEVAMLARAFGCELILSRAGVAGSFRSEATKAGCPTIVLEAGEVLKVEPAIVEYAVGGVLAALHALGMTDAAPRRPAYQITLTESRWMRAERGGLLRFHVAPGDFVRRGAALATNTTLTGNEQNTLIAPHDSIVIGMTTLPCIQPGAPVYHLGRIASEHGSIPRLRRRIGDDDLHNRVIDDLSTNIRVVEH